MTEPFWYYATFVIVLVVVLSGLLIAAIGEDPSDDLPESSLDP